MSDKMAADEALENSMRAAYSTRDGGPAFPHTVTCEHIHDYTVPGMTIRDYFAASVVSEFVRMVEARTRREVTDGSDYKAAATCAYLLADAMIRARKASPDPAK